MWQTGRATLRSTSWSCLTFSGMPGFHLPESETKTMTDDEREKIRADINKILAETMKINAEARWYPFVATAGIFAAAFGVVKLLGN